MSSDRQYLFRARIKGQEQVIVFFSEKARKEWVARDPENRERVLRPANNSYIPVLHSLWQDLPPFGQRVRGQLESGNWITVFRRKTPRPPGWTWAMAYGHANIKQSAILKWEPLA